LVRIYTLFHAHEIGYRVTKNLQTAPVLKKTDLFSNIHYSIRRFIEILTSFLQFIPANYRMHFLTVSKLSCTPQNTVSCLANLVIHYGQTEFCIHMEIMLKFENKFPESKCDNFANCQTDYGVLRIRLRVDVFKTLQKEYE